MPSTLLLDDLILDPAASRCNEDFVLGLLLTHEGCHCLGFIFLIVLQKLPDSITLPARLIERNFEKLVVFHGIFNLRFYEFIVAQSVRLGRLKFLHLSLLPLEDLVEDERLPLEPFDLRLEPGDVVVVADLASGFDGFGAQVYELLLDFGHMALVGGSEVFFVVLQYCLELSINLVDKVIQLY